MLPYGLPRHDDVEFPDSADCQLYGLAGNKMGADRKARNRRRWKRGFRQRAKIELAKAVEDFQTTEDEEPWY